MQTSAGYCWRWFKYWQILTLLYQNHIFPLMVVGSWMVSAFFCHTSIINTSCWLFISLHNKKEIVFIYVLYLFRISGNFMSYTWLTHDDADPISCGPFCFDYMALSVPRHRPAQQQNLWWNSYSLHSAGISHSQLFHNTIYANKIM